ncbi:LAME_0G18844g1_1 [Lachancea meyersii CBS 8951]|uniref:LAME_0G18844g1_1 n=1 Tax=Lachancea meyersii CBS 8951 TaxID=1266667 RepID=A0A1G4KC10_9SACH|nr:LAME_0G18844g1_1 [Lachancea meyersii CBS 8951]
MSDEIAPVQLIDDYKSAKDPARVAKDLAAGTAGGIAQVLVGQPFDTTKVRLQTSSTPTSAVEVVKNLVSKEGLRGFYKGTLTPLIGVGACVSCQFGVNEAMKRFFRGDNPNPSGLLSLPQYYTCGFVGGIANAFLASPIEHVRIRLQTQTGSGAAVEFSGPLDCIKKLVKGKALMRGLTPTLLREAHGCGTYFLTYEALVSNQVQKGVSRSDIPAWKLCCYGALSGTALWLMVYPLDVIKSIMQTDKISQQVHGKTTLGVTRNVYAKYGWKAFFKGFGPTMMRAAPANAATFATFELAMRTLG